jgi:hypothetical protein
LIAAALLVIVLGGAGFWGVHRSMEARDRIGRQTYVRLAPFDAIRWHGREADIRVAGQWYGLVAVDGIPLGRLLDADDTWEELPWRQKHVAEDMVELMGRLGHKPGPTVLLTVRPITGGDVHVIPNVPMTADNRMEVLRADLEMGVSPETRPSR